MEESDIVQGLMSRTGMADVIQLGKQEGLPAKAEGGWKGNAKFKKCAKCLCLHYLWLLEVVLVFGEMFTFISVQNQAICDSLFVKAAAALRAVNIQNNGTIL